MTTIDPAYQAKALQVTAQRETEAAARRIRRRICFNYGPKTDELIASTNPLHQIPALSEEAARALVAGIEVIPRTKGSFGESGRLGFRHSATNVVPLSLWCIRFLCSEYPDVAATLREAESDLA
jgi:hypothetical protein